MSLTEAQAVAVRAILPRLSRGGEIILAGYAGAGKTYTTGMIARALLAAGRSVLAVTHAHKALGPLRAGLPSDVEAMTIYAALGWRIDGRSQSSEAIEASTQLGTIMQASRDSYADLRHVYAMTAHRAQGSTFDAVIVDWADMAKTTDLATLCRLLYVAVTRPSRYLVVLA